ncbi:hypothetical protein ACP8Y2_10660 [Herpetosiphon llansteffanensis]
MKYRLGSLPKLAPLGWIILAGYLARFLIMPLSSQHDALYMPWHAHFVAQGHFNVYEHLYTTYGPRVIEMPVWVPYPYGFYAYTGFAAKIYDLLGLIDLQAWPSTWEIANPMRAVFLFKLLYLPFDLLIGWILQRVAGRLAWAMWAWSPTALFMLAMGQNDVYPTAAMLLGTYLVSRALAVSEQRQARRYGYWAMLVLGLGAGFKLVPLFLVPPLIVLLTRSWWQRLKLFGVSIAPLFLLSLPFLRTPAYVKGVLFNPEGTRIFDQVNFLSQPSSLFLLCYSLFLIFLLLYQRPWVGDSAWWVSIATLAIFFLWIKIPFYWLYWLAPFGIIAVLRLKRAALGLWMGAELTFGLTLLHSHRELNLNLFFRFIPEWQFINPIHALALRSELASQLLAKLRLLSESLQLALFISLIVLALINIYYGYQRPIKPVLRLNRLGLSLMPATMIAISLLLFVWIARSNAIRPREFGALTNMLVLDGQQPFVQGIIQSDQTEITGFALSLGQLPPANAKLQACVVAGSSERCAPLVVPREALWEMAGYAVFQPALAITPNQPFSVTLKTLEPSVPVAIHYRWKRQPLVLATSQVEGSLPIVAMEHAQFANGWQRLGRLLRADLLLCAIWLVVTSLGLLFVANMQRPADQRWRWNRAKLARKSK